MAFKFPISPESRSRLDHEKALTARFYSRTTTNLNLRLAILGIARKLRQAYCNAGLESSIQRDYPVYDGDLVWNVLPDLAYRLGVTDRTRYLPGERSTGEKVMTLEGGEYRRYVWSVLRNSDLRRLIDYTSQHAHAASLLNRAPINGNIVEIALQRLYPAEKFYDPTVRYHPGNTDPADEIREPAARRGYGEVLSWSPDLEAARETKSVL